MGNAVRRVANLPGFWGLWGIEPSSVGRLFTVLWWVQPAAETPTVTNMGITILNDVSDDLVAENLGRGEGCRRRACWSPSVLILISAEHASMLGFDLEALTRCDPGSCFSRGGVGSNSTIHKDKIQKPLLAG